MKIRALLIVSILIVSMFCSCSPNRDDVQGGGTDNTDNSEKVTESTSDSNQSSSDNYNEDGDNKPNNVNTDKDLPNVIGNYSDINDEITGYDVLRYSPFSSDKESSNLNSETMSTLYDNDSEKTANISESKTFAVFPKDRDDLCLVCSGLKIVKVLFRGNVWDFSNVGFNFDLTDGAPGSFIGKEYQQYSTESHFACTDDTLFLTSYSEKPLVIHDDKAYRVDEKLLFDGNSSRYAIITDGTMMGFETRNYDLIPENQTLEVNLKKMIDDNIDASKEIEYRIIGVDFSQSGSPFSVYFELSMDDFLDKAIINGDVNNMTYFLENFCPIDADLYESKVKQEIIDNNITEMSKVIELLK